MRLRRPQDDGSYYFIWVMRYRLTRAACLLSVCLMAAVSAHAETRPEPLDFTGRYTIYWSGIPLGSSVMRMTEKNGRYHIHATAETTGLFTQLFLRFTMDAKAEGWREAGGARYRPETSDVHYRLRKKQRRTTLRFSRDGLLTARTLEPSDPPGKRPDVPAAKQHRTYDFLSLLLAARRKTFDALHNGGKKLFAVPVYDGRRRSDVPFVVGTRFTKWLGGRERSIRKVLFWRIPIAGYRDKELKKLPRENPLVHFYFSDDARMIPLLAEAETDLGTGIIKLEKECESVEKCG